MRAGGPVTTGLSVAVDDVIVGLGGIDVESDFEPGDGTITVNPSNASKLSFGFSQETADRKRLVRQRPDGFRRNRERTAHGRRDRW